MRRETFVLALVKQVLRGMDTGLPGFEAVSTGLAAKGVNRAQAQEPLCDPLPVGAPHEMCATLWAG